MTSNDNVPKIFIITGPSGVGKDTVMRQLEPYGLPLQRVTTTTSRPMRANESEGNPYHFVTDERFQGMIDRDELAEYAKVFNSWKGISRDELEQVKGGNKGVLLQLDHQGAQTILNEYPHSVVIVITPPSVELLNQRLLRRGDKQPEELKKRLELNTHWQENFASFQYHVENPQDHPEKAATEVAEIIKKHLE